MSTSNVHGTSSASSVHSASNYIVHPVHPGAATWREGQNPANAENVGHVILPNRTQSAPIRNDRPHAAHRSTCLPPRTTPTCTNACSQPCRAQRTSNNLHLLRKQSNLTPIVSSTARNSTVGTSASSEQARSGRQAVSTVNKRSVANSTGNKSAVAASSVSTGR